MERPDGVSPWTASTLTSGDLLRIPEVDLEVGVDELYEAVDLPEEGY